MLTRIVKNAHSCLFPFLKGKTFHLLPLSVVLDMFFIEALCHPNLVTLNILYMVCHSNVCIQCRPLPISLCFCRNCVLSNYLLVIPIWIFVRYLKLSMLKTNFGILSVLLTCCSHSAFHLRRWQLCFSGQNLWNHLSSLRLTPTPFSYFYAVCQQILFPPFS